MGTAANPRLVFAIVSTGIVLATLDQFIVNIAFPSIEHSLHGSVSTLSWVLNGYSIVFAALLVPAGRHASSDGAIGPFDGPLPITGPIDVELALEAGPAEELQVPQLGEPLAQPQLGLTLRH